MLFKVVSVLGIKTQTRSVLNCQDLSSLGFAWCAFRRAKSGAIAVKFAVLLPVLMLFIGVAIDLSALSSQKTDLQSVADIGSVAGAKELSFSDVNRDNVSAVVKAVVDRYINSQNMSYESGSVKVNTVVTDSPLRVTVTLEKQAVSFFENFLNHEIKTLTATSSAEIIGKPNVCVLALDPGENGALSLEQQANVLGRDCSVFSNSRHTKSIKAKNSATLVADFICSHGGKSGGPGNFTPEPMTDCPGFSDPLSSRPEPFASSFCDYTDLVVDFETRSLTPGTYCGGLKITNSSVVTLDPGTYVIKDGPLVVDGHSSLLGKFVGFYFTGDDASLEFANESTVSLEAQKDGIMAGLLLFSDRAQSENTTYNVMSNDARVLLGTIYLPNGELRVGADGPVADQSAYTAIVARKMYLYGGPQLVLNTDYGKTEIPVPEGIRGVGQPVRLVN